MLEHLNAITGGKGTSSAITKHHLDVHKDERSEYDSRIKYTYRSNQKRMACEALVLLDNFGNVLMIRKGEFGKVVLRRIEIRDQPLRNHKQRD